MKWILGILCLFFLIIFHELGHFLAAKLCGVTVESFSVGFGPILLHKKFKGTDYRLSLIPLGGYCGMKGEKDFQYALENKMESIPQSEGSLYAVHPLKRALIGFAGPFFNYIFAVFSYFLIALIGYTYYTYSNQIILAPEIYEDSSTIALEAGLKTGDKIIQINNKKIENFSDIISEISVRPDEDVTIIVDRDGDLLSFTLHTELDKETGSGKIGIAADQSNILQQQSEHYNVFTAIIKGFKDTFEYINLTLKSIAILFKGVEIKNAVSGPARITDMLGSTVMSGFSQSFKTGVISFFSLMGIISLSLFIMNLLPIPILDGGLILVAIIEFIFRKKISPKIQYYIQFIGIAFIAMIFIIGLMGDISYFTSKVKK